MTTLLYAYSASEVTTLWLYTNAFIIIITPLCACILKTLNLLIDQCNEYLADSSTDSSLAEAISKHSTRSVHIVTSAWL